MNCKCSKYYSFHRIFRYGSPLGPKKRNQALESDKEMHKREEAGTKNFQGVVFICMAPAALTPDPNYSQKLIAYQNLHTVSCFNKQVNNYIF